MTDQKNKPGLDQQTFGKILEAAFVLQEHNREMRQIEESLELQSENLRQQEAESQAALQKSAQRPAEPERANADYTLTLADIVEAQHQIRIRHLESDQAMAVVAERTARITHASGAAIGVLEGKTIRYRAGAGSSALPVGSEVPMESAICAMCVRTGQVLRTPDVNTEFLFDPELCHPRRIQSLVAVPIYHDGNIVGALELYFDRPKGFAEQDVHTCQLMAGLVTEAIGRGAESALKQSMAEERSSMMAAIEKLTPSLMPLAAEPQSPPPGRNRVAPAESAAQKTACWKCGGQLVAEEQFCGGCGAARVSESDRSSMQSKVASALHMQQASQGILPTPLQHTNGAESHDAVGARLNATTDEIDVHELAASLSLEKNDPFLAPASVLPTPEEAPPTALSLVAQGTEENADRQDLPGLATAKEQDFTWSSAAKARDFLESLAGTGSPSALVRFWRARRGDFYLAIAVILVAVVVRWGILSSRPVAATGGTAVAPSAARHKPAPETNLSAFDRFLISVGLAEPPETPEYKGNPDTQVWIDVHTALYYCPGAELYGKTPKGRFASQRDAQLDQFESASRKVCD